ncbi:hypothetical protein DLM75_15925 [Leptospira stimsonii]|uniref:Uncharacterized protein n=1 Tax=Leptospira stimsonii TaxID=2202203 RepID=A0A396Z6K4_9LEPT|nr:hypothetical protein DLM75_15925 [Leptospira stimsonii]
MAINHWQGVILPYFPVHDIHRPFQGRAQQSHHFEIVWFCDFGCREEFRPNFISVVNLKRLCLIFYKNGATRGIRFGYKNV